MSDDNTNSECSPSANNKRSHSLLRQVRATLTGKYRRETTDRSLSVSLLREKYRSFDNISTEKFQQKHYIIPNSFSHRLSLFNQVKSHIIGHRKYHRTVPSSWTDDDYFSCTSIHFNSVSHSYYKE